MAVHKGDIFDTLIVPNDYAKCNDNPFDENLIEYCKFILNMKLNLTPNQATILKNAISNPDKLDRFEKESLWQFLDRLNKIIKSPSVKYISIIGDGKAKEFYQKIGKKFQTQKNLKFNSIRGFKIKNTHLGVKLGEEGIRTLGTLFTYDGFQDRSDQPLRHFSISYIGYNFILSKKLSFVKKKYKNKVPF